MPQRHFTTVAEFRDKYDTVRTIHKKSAHTTIMRLKRNSETPIHRLSKAVATIVGQKIRAARQAAGLTMEELAERASVTGGKSRLYDIENVMNGGLKIGTLYAIAHALDVEPWSLMPTRAEAMDAAGVESRSADTLRTKAG